MMPRSVFSAVGALHPARSSFRLNKNVQFDAKFGQLIPVYARYMVPGDVFKYGAQAVVRLTPLVAPAYVGMTMKVVACAMPLRNLMGKNFDQYFDDYNDGEGTDHSSEGEFSDFISGGRRGDSTVVLPRWTPTSETNVAYSLWDYLTYPVGVIPSATSCPLDFKRRMYNVIWNYYFRNEFLEDPVAPDNSNILYVNWKRDYFTTCLPSQQLGTPPALPVSGQIPVSGYGSLGIFDYATTNLHSPVGSAPYNANVTPPSGGQAVQLGNFVGTTGSTGTADTNYSIGVDPVNHSVLGDGVSDLYVDLSNATTFDVSDLRLAFQLQKWQERNMRGGVRYSEFLRSHFGVTPSDGFLNNPIFVGQMSFPIVTSEVLQTSATQQDSPQGNLAGHGLGTGSGYIGSYRAEEYSLFMVFAYITPDRGQYSQGIPREDLYLDKEDFYFPEFMNLSEQAVTQDELFVSSVESDNKKVFGYQGRYNEMRCDFDAVVGGFRDTWAHWNLSREFATAPVLNQEFLSLESVDPRIFAVQDEPPFLVNFQNVVKAIRPMCYYPEPGLIDHH